jgi:hypothetical protein
LFEGGIVLDTRIKQVLIRNKGVDRGGKGGEFISRVAEREAETLRLRSSRKAVERGVTESRQSQ